MVMKTEAKAMPIRTLVSTCLEISTGCSFCARLFCSAFPGGERRERHEATRWGPRRVGYVDEEQGDRARRIQYEQNRRFYGAVDGYSQRSFLQQRAPPVAAAHRRGGFGRYDRDRDNPARARPRGGMEGSQLPGG